MKQQINFADVCIAIFDLGPLNHRVLDEKTSFIIEVNLKYQLWVHERDDYYQLAIEVMTI